MEIWDLYDIQGNKTGETLVRGDKVPEGRYHLVVHVWIKNSEGKYLVSQRSADRHNFPLLWECVGGSVVRGEDSLTGALRECEEEIGVSLEPSHGRIVFSRARDVINGKRYGDIMDVWLFEYNGIADLKKATTYEVADVRWATVEEIRELWDRGEFVPTLGYFFDEIA
ncbi:MAG: NUDIX domain-containing protein [Clostridia bacterium]|nr:NUDIX domain-containing protein [Clostridia bacterium]